MRVTGEREYAGGGDRRIALHLCRNLQRHDSQTLQSPVAEPIWGRLARGVLQLPDGRR